MDELSHFFEYSPVPLCILNAQRNCCFVNPAFERVLGYSQQEVCDRTLSDLAHAEDTAAVSEALNSLTSQPAQGRPSARFTARYRSKSGSYHWLEWTASVRFEDESHVVSIYCVAKEIVAQPLIDFKAAKQAKIEALLYAATVQNIQIGLYIWHLDDPDNSASLRLLATNPAASQFTGIPATADIIGKEIAEVFPALAKTEIPNIYAQVALSGKGADLGEIAYGDDRVEQGIFDVKAFPLPNRCIGIAFENITERKRYEQLHAEQETQLRTIFEQAGVGIARLSPKGKWIQVNQRLCDMLGYSRAALMETTLTDITHPDDSQDDADSYRQLLQSKNSQMTLEKRYITQAGGVLWALVNVSLVRNADQTPLYLIATVQDITQRKDAYTTLNQQKNELVTINLMLTDTLSQLEQRNQELDQFAYVTSHDLKAPLRAIANLANWIEEDLGKDLPAENAEQFGLLKSRVHRMEGLINGLLEYSRIGRTHQSHERIEVAQLLEDITDSISALGEFEIEIAPNMPVVEAARAPLTQVFSNLIVNAIKHHDRKAGHIKVSVREVEDMYEFAIADDGPGIEAAYHDKIFTIFQTLKARDELESTGIGLSLVKKIVTAEGGKISVRSNLGEGATFLFTWPKRPYQGITFRKN